MWYQIDLLNSDQAEGISARVRVPDASPWFSGHFPEFPVLPGIAQLDMVRQALSRATRKEVRVRGLRRIRFKQMVRPGQALDLAICPLDRTGFFSFRITSENDPVCTGTMEIVEKPNEPTRTDP